MIPTLIPVGLLIGCVFHVRRRGIALGLVLLASAGWTLLVAQDMGDVVVSFSLAVANLAFGGLIGFALASLGSLITSNHARASS